MRQGIIAWTPTKKGKDFIIDSPIFPGNSGGPVFFYPTGIDKAGNFQIGGHIKFLGIVSKVYNETLETYRYDTVMRKMIAVGFHKQRAGLGVVVPTSRVLELLTQATEKMSKK